MKQFLVFVSLFFILIQCDLITSDVTYSRQMIPAHITDFELVPPIHFGNDFYQISGAKFLVAGEKSVIYDVRYKVFGTVWFCGNGRQDAIDIASEVMFIADSLHISSKTIHIGKGIEYLTAPIDVGALMPGQQQFAGTVGVSIYYKNDDGEKQISKSDSYDYSNLYCQ